MSKAAELAALIGSQSALSNKNLIINGAMQVAARGDVTGVQSGYGGADRYQFLTSSAARVTLSRDTDVPSNQGFTSSQKVDVTTADASLAAGDYVLFRQKIEAQNLQHLKYGTSEAKKVTLQFWVKSPKTGTHICELSHGDVTYFNSQTYTIATADTWQKVTLTFDGYQTTAINNDNGVGLQVVWWLLAGSTYSGGTLSENTWHNTNANRAVGQVNVMDNTSNNFYITGVQLEVGEQATPFEHRSYGDELARCQRYYYRINEGSTYQRFLVGSCQGTGYANGTVPFPVEMRSSPTLETTGTASQYAVYAGDSVRTCGSVPAISSTGTNENVANVSFAASVTNGQAAELLANNNTSVYLAFAAEL